jgi:hypothetical protein
MYTVILFHSNSCPRCPAAIELVNSFEGINVKMFNVGEGDGLGEAAWYGAVKSVPTVIVEKNDIIVARLTEGAVNRDKLRGILTEWNEPKDQPATSIS